MSHRLGWIDDSVIARAKALFEACQLPVEPPSNMSPEDFLHYMSVDKKVIDGTLRLVLLRALGEATVTSDFSAEQLHATLVSSLA